MTTTNYLRVLAILTATVAAAFVTLFVLASPAMSGTTTWTVTKTADTNDGACDSDCSLREAISSANSAAGSDTINFASGVSTLTLTLTAPHEDANLGGDLDITDDLTIDGGSGVIIEGTTGWSERILDVIGGSTVASRTDVTITEATVRNGKATVGGIESSKGGGIQVNGNAKVFGGASLTLQQSTVTDNTAGAPGTSGVGGGVGGGIHDQGGSSITLQDSTVSNNIAGNGVNGGGGGIFSTGPLTLTNSTVTGNEGVDVGGGIFIGGSGTATITDSTVSGNTVASPGSNTNGGGIYAFATGPVTLTKSTISGNTAESSADGDGAGEGGGIYAIGTTPVTLVNTTVSGNTAENGSQLNADGRGGGIYTSTALTLANATIANNTAGDPGTSGRGGGIFGDTGSSTTLRNTIVAANNADISPDGAGAFTSQGYNLIGDASVAFFFNQPGDQTGVANPGLNSLANNGGPTQTHALQTGSPAIDAGNPAAPGSGGNACEATDQRGDARPVDGDGNGTATCDIGAFEKAAGGGGGGGDTNPPTVSSTDPFNGQTKVLRNKTVTVNFSEPMNTSTLTSDTVKLVDTKTGLTVPATLTPSSTSVSIDPSALRLAKKRTYRIEIEGGNDSDGFAVEDVAGNDMTADYSSQFKTGKK